MSGFCYLSIIIPFYKVPLFLFENCLRSVCCQGVFSGDYEVIVIDDGSPTSPECIINKIEFQNVIYIKQDNMGLGGARNTGLLGAHGLFALFVDGDDYLMPGALQEVVNWIKNNEKKNCPSDLLRFNYAISNRLDLQDDGSDLNPTTYLVSKYFERNNLACTVWRNIFRRSLVVTSPSPLLFVPNLLHEDELWTPQLMLRVKQMDVSSKQLYCYYKNTESIMHNGNFERSDRDWMFVVSELNRIQLERNKTDFFEFRFKKSIVAKLHLMFYQRAEMKRIEKYVKEIHNLGLSSFRLRSRCGGVNLKMQIFAFVADYKIGRYLFHKFLF